MFLRKRLFGLSIMILASGMVAFAQQPSTQTSNPANDNARKDKIERRERRREMMGRRERNGIDRPGDMGRILRELNLTDQQRQQSRAILERQLESTKAQREELIKLREKKRAGALAAEDEARVRVLHQEIRAARVGGRSEIERILTSDQKAKLEELKKDRKGKIKQRMKERQDLLNKTPR